jgi:sarcosine oxidase gamma subunit
MPVSLVAPIPNYVADFACVDVSGMKEDLKIEGNEYTYMLSKGFRLKLHE